MEEIAKEIYEIIKDYRNEDGIFISCQDILAWGLQFDNDAEFILSEVRHILKQVYCSKSAAKEAIKIIIDAQRKNYKFESAEEYWRQTCFLDMQPEGKSQKALLEMLDEIIFEEVGRHLVEYQTYQKSLYVYLDDVLATGGTIRKDLICWLTQNNNAELLRQKKIRLELAFICVHSWGLQFLFYGINQRFGNAVNYTCRWLYEIQNHLKMGDQSLNVAIPVKEYQSAEVLHYLTDLAAQKYEDYAFREANKPIEEKFFSSAENRVRYENILLKKGLYIIDQIKGPVNPSIRPLGIVNPNYRIFGLGTHFFTWRNVPNNCPLVFWWNVLGHNWKPLFPPKR